MTYELYWYRTLLEYLSCYHRDVMELTRRLKEGEDVNLRRITYAAVVGDELKQEFLNQKKAQGLPGGADFLFESNSFLDFTIENGRLKDGSNMSDIYTVTQKWIDSFPSNFNAHNFEVAVWARVLCNPDYISDEELYPLSIREVDPRSIGVAA